MQFSPRRPFAALVLGLAVCALLVNPAPAGRAEMTRAKSSRTQPASRAAAKASPAAKLDKGPETVVTVTRPGEESAIRSSGRPVGASPPAGDSAKGPVIAMLDFESATLDNETQKAVSQAVWARLNAAGNVEMLPRESTRNWLISNDLYPFAPYQRKPAFSEIAQAINADYLISGHVDRVERSYTLDANVFSLRKGSFILRGAELRQMNLDGLLTSLTPLNRQIQSAIRDDLPPAEQAAFSAKDLSGKKTPETGKAKSKRVVAQVKRAPTGIKKQVAASAKTDADTTATTEKPTTEGDITAQKTGDQLTTQSAAGNMAPNLSKPPAPGVEAQVSAAENAQKMFNEYLDKSMSPAERLAKLEEAARLMPNDLLYQRQLASEYYKQRDFKKSIAQADQALKIKPNDTMTLTVKGVALYEAGELDKAGEAYQEALKADANNHWARYNYALTLTKKKDPGAAQSWRDYLAKAQGEATQQNMVTEARRQLGALEASAAK